MLSSFVVISGCSGGGKSALLAELARRGYATVEEPGRRIVRQELESRGDALPWRNAAAFARRAIAVANEDYAAADATQGWTFFDRGLVDAAAALEHLTGEEALNSVARRMLYHRCVFLAPPWPELFTTDAERRHTFGAATQEYERLVRAYSRLGHDCVELPTASVLERANFVLATLRAD